MPPSLRAPLLETTPGAPLLDDGTLTRNALREAQIDAAGGNSFTNAFTSAGISNEANLLGDEVSSLRAAGDPTSLLRAEQLMARNQALQEQASAYRPAVGRWEDVNLGEEGGLGRAGSFVAGQLGQGFGSSLPQMATGVGMNAAATGLQLIPHPLAKAAGTALRYAAPVEMYRQNKNLLTGEAYNTVSEDPTVMANRSAQDIRDQVSNHGYRAAVMDTLPQLLPVAQVTGGFTKALSKVPKSVKFAGTMLGEGVTETGQQYSQQLAHTELNPDRDTSGDMSELQNSFAGGAIGGGGFAAVGHVGDMVSQRLAGQRNIPGKKGDETTLSKKGDESTLVQKITGMDKTGAPLPSKKQMLADAEKAFKTIQGMEEGPDPASPDYEPWAQGMGARRRDAVLAEIAREPKLFPDALQQEIAAIDPTSPDAWDHPAFDQAAKIVLAENGPYGRKALNELAKKAGSKNKYNQEGEADETPGSKWRAEPLPEKETPAAKDPQGSLDFGRTKQPAFPYEGGQWGGYDGPKTGGGEVTTPVKFGGTEGAPKPTAKEDIPKVQAASPAAAKAVAEQRKAAQEDFKQRASLTADTLWHVFQQQFKVDGFTPNRDHHELIRGWGHEIAAMATEGFKSETFGESKAAVQRAQQIGREVGARLGPRTAAVMKGLEQANAAGDSPVFKAFKDKAIEFSDDNVSSFQKHSVDRAEAAQDIQSLVTPEAHAKLLKAGISMLTDEGDGAHNLLGLLEDYHNGEGDHSYEHFVKLFGKESADNMLAYTANHRIEPRLFQLDPEETNGTPVTHTDMESVEDDEEMDDGESVFSAFNKGMEQKSFNRVPPDSHVMFHGKPTIEDAADPFGQSRGGRLPMLVTKDQRNFKLGDTKGDASKYTGEKAIDKLLQNLHEKLSGSGEAHRNKFHIKAIAAKELMDRMDMSPEKRIQLMMAYMLQLSEPGKDATPAEMKAYYALREKNNAVVQNIRDVQWLQRQHETMTNIVSKRDSLSPNELARASQKLRMDHEAQLAEMRKEYELAKKMGDDVEAKRIHRGAEKAKAEFAVQDKVLSKGGKLTMREAALLKQQTHADENRLNEMMSAEDHVAMAAIANPEANVLARAKLVKKLLDEKTAALGDITTAPNEYFADKYLALAENLSNKDPNQLNTVEVSQMAAMGARILSKAKQFGADKTNGPGAEARKASEGNLIRFLSPLKKDKAGKPQEIAVPAHMLIDHVIAMREAHQTVNQYGKYHPRNQRSALMEGIATLIGSGHVAEGTLPYIINDKGEREKFGETTTLKTEDGYKKLSGMPPSLTYSGMRQDELEKSANFKAEKAAERWARKQVEEQQAEDEALQAEIDDEQGRLFADEEREEKDQLDEDGVLTSDKPREFDGDSQTTAAVTEQMNELEHGTKRSEEERKYHEQFRKTLGGAEDGSFDTLTKGDAPYRAEGVANNLWHSIADQGMARIERVVASLDHAKSHYLNAKEKREGYVAGPITLDKNGDPTDLSRFVGGEQYLHPLAALASPKRIALLETDPKHPEYAVRLKEIRAEVAARALAADIPWGQLGRIVDHLSGYTEDQTRLKLPSTEKPREKQAPVEKIKAGKDNETRRAWLREVAKPYEEKKAAEAAAKKKAYAPIKKKLKAEKKLEAEKKAAEQIATPVNQAAEQTDLFGSTPEPLGTFPMSFKDGQVVGGVTLRMRPEFVGKDTMDLILSGDRTATTGTLGRFKGAKKGDVVIAKGNGKQALIRFTSDPYLVKRGTNEAWSKIEGWAPDVMNEYLGQYQATYELVGKTEAKASKTPVFDTLPAPKIVSEIKAEGLTAEIAKRQEYLDNPPADYTTAQAKTIAEWANRQLTRVMNEKSADIDRQDQLSDYKAALLALQKKAASVLEGDASLQDFEGGNGLIFNKERQSAIDKVLEEQDKKFQESQEKTTDPERQPTTLAIKQATAYIDRVAQTPLGEAITKVFQETFKGYKGKWDQQKQTMSIATAHPWKVMQLAYHESMHAFYGNILQNMPEVKAMLDRGLLQDPKVMERMHDYLEGSPLAQKAIANDAEERAAYAFQFWRAGLLPMLGKQPQGFFEHVQRFFRRVFNIVRDQEKAYNLFTALDAGQLKEQSAAGKAIAKIMAEGTWQKQFAEKFDKQNIFLKTYVQPNQEMMLGSESKTVHDIARMWHANPADARSHADGPKGDGMGVLDNTRVEGNKYEGYFRQNIRGLNEAELTELVGHLNDKTVPTVKSVQEVQKHMFALMDKFHKYAKKAGLDLGVRDTISVKYPDGTESKGSYWPVVFDLEYMVENKKQFTDMLKKEYMIVLDAAKLAYDKGGKTTTVDDVADAFHQAIIDRGGVSEEGMDAIREDGILNPYFASENRRHFDWIAAEHRAPFLSKDIVATMTRYISQGVRSAEYVRAWGQGGQKLRDLMAIQGDEEVGGKEPKYYKEDGPAAKEFLEHATTVLKMKDTEARKWMIGRIETMRKANGAMEGSLGKDISLGARKANMIATTYEAVRLLPFSLFSAMIDPVGMKVAGGTYKDMWETYKRGITDVFATWKDVLVGNPIGGRPDDQFAMNAAMMGTVDSTLALASQGAAHTSEYSAGFARRINRGLFIGNGMTAWDRAMRIMATEAGSQFIVRHMMKPEANSKRWLKGLGLENRSDVTIEDGRLVVNPQDLAAIRAKVNGTTVKEEIGKAREDIKKTHVAVYRWVNRSILTPNAAQRPMHASDPHYQALYQLKMFSYAFHQTTLKYAMSEMKEGNADALAQMSIGLPIMMASGLMKGLILGGGTLPGYMQHWDAADYLLDAAKRTGGAGAWQNLFDIAEHPTGVLGPAMGQGAGLLGEVALGGDVGGQIHSAIPGVRYIKGTPDIFKDMGD